MTSPKKVTLHNLDTGFDMEVTEQDLADMLDLSLEKDEESYRSILYGFFGFDEEEKT